MARAFSISLLIFCLSASLKPPPFSTVSERMKAIAVGFQQARDSTQCSKGFTLTVGSQQADRFAELGSELARQCHGSELHRSPLCVQYSSLAVYLCYSDEAAI